jgi:D-alanyl-D-alanine carboxypeptidase (penicillin-binding protein 5/6)
MMTTRGRQMGMENSTFTNSNGWPQAGHRMSMRDLAILANLLISDFPEFYPLFAEREFAFDGRAPQNKTNRNPLLGLGIGADGLKTGHTQEAGYGLVGSAKQGNRRVIFVISGLPSAKARAEESEAIVNWAFRQFVQRPVAKAGTVIAQADIWMGDEPRVGLVPAKDVTALLPALNAKQVEAEVVYNGPIAAPVTKGQEIATLVLKPADMPPVEVPLVAERDVAKGGFISRVATVAQILLGRLNDGPEGAT